MMRERIERKKRMETVYRQNLMNDNLVLARFGNFIPRPGTKLMLRECQEFANNFEKQKVGLLGFGVPGNGKSHLFVSVHHQVASEGYVSLFLECQRLFNIAEDAKKFSSKVSLNDIINATINCDLLTLDEIGAGKLTQDQFTDILFPIINGRQGKLTNYTTNLDLDELATWFAVDKYGKPLDSKGRLIDRILGSCNVIANNGTSKRQEDASKRLGGG
jgi:DNA replication protein DnaC